MTTPQPALLPHVPLIQMAIGYWVSQLVATTARIGLADQLAAGPKSATALAADIGADPRALHRLMRTPASLGMLAQGGDERFTLTPL